MRLTPRQPYRRGAGSAGNGAPERRIRSRMLQAKLRQPGMETRCPEGAGQRQRSWLGAKHDIPGSRQGSRPASVKPDREQALTSSPS
ncbi:hypothetical protein ACEY0N_003275 [Escherichia coli]